jgi:hypothetical protein
VRRRTRNCRVFQRTSRALTDSPVDFRTRLTSIRPGGRSPVEHARMPRRAPVLHTVVCYDKYKPLAPLLDRGRT